MEPYIKNAGGTIVTKSILAGTSKLKWLFRQESEFGNGWIAFGDKDTQEYVDNAENLKVVDYNTLAQIEPTIWNVYDMPIGTDLEFCSDETGTYFVNTKTGEEIREPVKSPMQIAFEKNLKFLNRETYEIGFFERFFQPSKEIKTLVIGEIDFPTGEVVLADPLAYLGTKYETDLDRKIETGSYPVELSFYYSKIVGVRIAAARFVISNQPAVCYELAMPKGYTTKDIGKRGVWSFFGVDTGLACFSDLQVAKKYKKFIEQWRKEHPEGNIYTDYFAEFFQKSFEKYPDFQKDGGSFLLWQIPETEYRLTLFSSGMGDGVYSGYWGLDAEGEVTCFVIPFMNPEYF